MVIVEKNLNLEIWYIIHKLQDKSKTHGYFPRNATTHLTVSVALKLFQSQHTTAS